MVIPETMRTLVESSFGSLDAAQIQITVRVTNSVTLESAIFNPLRASRPLTVVPGDLKQIIDDARGDAFCTPERSTPEDLFGRIRGQHSITASNIARYAPFHGLVIFNEHNPLVISEDAVADYLEVGRHWAEEVLKVDPEAKYYFFAWNCLWSSGASIIHGHAQVSCVRDAHYGKVEQLRRAARAYSHDFGRDYFEDLEQAHMALGLAFRREDVAAIAHLTPVRDREVLLIAPEGSQGLPGAIYRTLDCLTAALGTRSFNVAVYQPPLRSSPEDWSRFPTLVRIVDRGDPMKRTADVGSMELYGSPVIPTDPFHLAEALKERFGV